MHLRLDQNTGSGDQHRLLIPDRGSSLKIAFFTETFLPKVDDRARILCTSAWTKTQAQAISTAS